MRRNGTLDQAPAPVRKPPSPVAALVLFGCALIGILAWALAASSLAVPKSAFMLLALAMVLLITAVVVKRRPLTAWMIGAGIAVLGLLAGAYSLVLLPASMAEGNPAIASVARAATALASLGFLLWAALAWRHCLRGRRAQSALTPIGWR